MNEMSINLFCTHTMIKKISLYLLDLVAPQRWEVSPYFWKYNVLQKHRDPITGTALNVPFVRTVIHNTKGIMLAYNGGRQPTVIPICSAYTASATSMEQ